MMLQIVQSTLMVRCHEKATTIQFFTMLKYNNAIRLVGVGRKNHMCALINRAQNCKKFRVRGNDDIIEKFVPRSKMLKIVSGNRDTWKVHKNSRSTEVSIPAI